MANEIQFVRHDTPESLALVFFNLDPESPVTDLSEVDCGGSTEDGEHVDIGDGHAYVAGIRDMGFWGFAKVSTREIHYWTDDPSSPYLLYFFAHEIGHLSGKGEDDEMAEEARANTYGDVAVMAIGELARLRGVTPDAVAASTHGKVSA